MKVALISPCLKDPRNIGKSFHLPQMALALIAGLTPRDVEVSITDELVQPIDFGQEVDLVGITVSTKTVVRAYEIADAFRARGVPVVLGGIHPSVVPHEAVQHADAVVIGEAEGVWTQVLEDCRRGELSKFYRSHNFPSLEKCPLPRRDLFQGDKYDTLNLVQTSRGCPFACHFCSISALYGKEVRLRPVEAVLQEIETLEGNGLFLVDDNIVGRSKYAKQLFTGLIPLKKKWIGQASVTAADKEEMLKLLHKSGCQGLFIGFETTSAEALREVGKSQNLRKDYIEVVKRFHDNGISILGSFIVGFDTDDESCFKRLLDFALKSKIDALDLSILTPYPGTVFYDRMKAEKRLISDNWWARYEANDVVYKPRLMTREELYRGWLWIIQEFYKLRPMLYRYVGGIGRRSLFGNTIDWKVNMGYRRMIHALPEKGLNPAKAE